MLFATTPAERPLRHLDIPLFADCTPRELRRIDRLAATLTVAAGRVLCHRGDIGRECFVLLDGQRRRRHELPPLHGRVAARCSARSRS